ncbi:MAG TPA: hypothetical protein VH414_00635 [Lichenihabitans sp.]|jgi:hypothetical protein|nr:hypothetical protein [Lichenihabitans sp.]
MSNRILLAAAGAVAICGLGAAAGAQTLPFPPYDQLGRYRAAGENPYYHVNRYGYGNYVRGPNGSLGGYPAGSGAARELEINHELKCRYYPETC